MWNNANSESAIALIMCKITLFRRHGNECSAVQQLLSVRPPVTEATAVKNQVDKTMKISNKNRMKIKKKEEQKKKEKEKYLKD